jgi:hypothetical protein
MKTVTKSVMGNTQPASLQTLPEMIDVLRKITSRLNGISNSVLSGKLKPDRINSYLLELDEVVDNFNVTHSRLMEACEYGDIVKDGEIEMQREHYNRYMEVRRYNPVVV